MDYLHRSLATEMPGRWIERAACVGESERLFFPEKGDAHSITADAKAICARCPVRRQCLDFAIDTNQSFGIWGGTTVRERRRLRRGWRRRDTA